MITNEQLATVVIRRAIFHDVPVKPRGGSASPTLSEIETPLDVRQKAHLRNKLIRALGSKSAYPVEFNPSSASPVPDEIRAMTSHGSRSKQLVESSQRLANYLFEQQTGAISPGLLCVLDITIAGSSGAVLMKLERHEGAQLKLSTQDGKKTFSMSVLGDLVLTDSTRLFKAAIFLRADDDDFQSTACDSQLNVTSSEDFAKFWLRFLGCAFIVEPRVATQKFFESSVRFINENVADPVLKSEMYDSLQSELKSQRKTFSPKHFIEEYVHRDFQNAFREHLIEDSVPTTAFPKDTVDIARRLRRRAYETRRGAMVSVPEDDSNLVIVSEDQIIVNDSVIHIK